MEGARMKNNVVIFGAGNSGKTTLAGYLCADSISEYQRNKRFQKWRNILGAKYDEVERYSYFISSKDEIRNPNEDNAGNTKRLHFNEYKSEFVIVDTPGSEHGKVDKNKGVFMGDIGIYLVDSKTLLCFENEFGIFSYLFLWNTLKTSEKLLIAITKIDLLTEQELIKVMDKAKFIFNEQFKLNVPIIPISINRETGANDSVNILNNNDFHNELNQNTLIGFINAYIKTDDNYEKSSEFCIYAETYFDHKLTQGSGVGRTWRNKILSGSVEKNSGIKIIPIKYKGKYTMCRAKIKNIRKLDNCDYDYASHGEIIGLDLSDIRVEGELVKKTEIVSNTGTIMVDEKCIVHCGNILRFNFHRSDFDNYRQLKPNENMRLHWFGKVIDGTIINIYAKKDIINIIFCIPNSFVAIPIIKQEFLFKRFALMYIENYDSEQKKYFNVNLDKIGSLDNVTLVVNDIANIDTVREVIDCHISKDDNQISVVENKIIITCSNKSAIVRLLKDIYCALGVEKAFNTEESIVEYADVKIKILPVLE
jgi:translation elongation factor EF-1alpha